jgi:hypothetical protein
MINLLEFWNYHIFITAIVTNSCVLRRYYFALHNLFVFYSPYSLFLAQSASFYVQLGIFVVLSGSAFLSLSRFACFIQHPADRTTLLFISVVPFFLSQYSRRKFKTWTY